MTISLQIFGYLAVTFAFVPSAYTIGIGIEGECPNIPTVQNFNAQAFFGKWYEYAKYPFIFEAFGKCISAEYGLLPNGDVSVLNKQINQLTSMPSSIQGSASIVGSGKLLVTFPQVPAFVGPANYWVIGTDYNNYAVIWSCTKVLNIFRSEVAWILTREQFPSPQIIETGKQILTRNGLSLQNLIVTDQNNCNFQ